MTVVFFFFIPVHMQFCRLGLDRHIERRGQVEVAGHHEGNYGKNRIHNGVWSKYDDKTVDRLERDFRVEYLFGYALAAGRDGAFGTARDFFYIFGA